MKPNEVTIRADGIDYSARLIQRRLMKKRDNEKRKILGILFRDVDNTTAREGRLVPLTSLDGEVIPPQEKTGYGSFYFGIRECRDYDTSHHTLELRHGKMVLRLEQDFNHRGFFNTSGTIRTRAHWYEPWQERKLENPAILWKD